MATKTCIKFQKHYVDCARNCICTQEQTHVHLWAGYCEEFVENFYKLPTEQRHTVQIGMERIVCDRRVFLTKEKRWEKSEKKIQQIYRNGHTRFESFGK